MGNEHELMKSKIAYASEFLEMFRNDPMYKEANSHFPHDFAKYLATAFNMDFYYHSFHTRKEDPDTEESIVTGYYRMYVESDDASDTLKFAIKVRKIPSDIDESITFVLPASKNSEQVVKMELQVADEKKSKEFRPVTRR